MFHYPLRIIPTYSLPIDCLLACLPIGRHLETRNYTSHIHLLSLSVYVLHSPMTMSTNTPPPPITQHPTRFHQPHRRVCSQLIPSDESRSAVSNNSRSCHTLQFRRSSLSPAPQNSNPRPNPRHNRPSESKSLLNPFHMSRFSRTGSPRRRNRLRSDKHPSHRTLYSPIHSLLRSNRKPPSLLQTSRSQRIATGHSPQSSRSHHAPQRIPITIIIIVFTCFVHIIVPSKTVSSSSIIIIVVIARQTAS